MLFKCIFAPAPGKILESKKTLPDCNPFVVKAEGEASVRNCYIKCEVQKEQELCGNSEEGEFISTRRNPGTLPEESGLDPDLLQNTSGTYAYGGRAVCHPVST